jgi:hypothetical protein
VTWVAFLVLAGLLAHVGRAATLDQLKGHSFEITATRVVQFRDAGKAIQQQWVHRIYIGQAGTVFEYTGYDLGPAGSGSGATAIAPDRAASLAWGGRMKAWDIQGGNLTKMVQQVEGVLILTIGVDPSVSSCTFTLQTRLDPTTQRLVFQTPQGAQREVVSVGMSSYVCSVKKGNVFAADQ